MKTTKRGHLAEQAVAKYLTSQAFEILELNWRTPRCEIDVIAQKDEIIYFCEVKYRGSQTQGDGFEYITPKKLNQMRYAAEIWINEHEWSGDYRLLAAAVSGDNYDKVSITELD